MYREREMCIWVHTYIYIYRERDMYVCIYIYIYRERDKHIHLSPKELLPGSREYHQKAMAIAALGLDAVATIITNIIAISIMFTSTILTITTIIIISIISIIISSIIRLLAGIWPCQCGGS